MKLLSSVKAYPYRERLPYAVLMICVCAWMLRHSWPGTPIYDALVGVLFLTLFCGPKGRPFWFLWGLLVGAFLMAINDVHPWKF
jgi:hypothetical protein